MSIHIKKDELGIGISIIERNGRTIARFLLTVGPEIAERHAWRPGDKFRAHYANGVLHITPAPLTIGKVRGIVTLQPPRLVRAGKRACQLNYYMVFTFIAPKWMIERGSVHCVRLDSSQYEFGDGADLTIRLPQKLIAESDEAPRSVVAPDPKPVEKEPLVLDEADIIRGGYGLTRRERTILATGGLLSLALFFAGAALIGAI